jgi:hypothetical protein
MSRENSGYDLPDDAPDPPKGFDEPQFNRDEEPPRYNCLVCDERFLEEDELRDHVEDHRLRDIYGVLRPVNFPTVAWYVDDSVPFTTYTHRAARYAQNVLDEEGISPEPAQRLANGNDPLTGEPVDSTHPTTLARKLPHSEWELYQLLRESVPDEYEHSPVFDDGGYPEPAATVNRLQPDDNIAWRAQGWSQSLGTPRGQTREKISNDDCWTGEGTVTGIEDSRTEPGPSVFDDGLSRTVTVVANTELFDDSVTVMLEPRSDGDVSVKLQPQVRQDAAVKRKGHGGPGYTKSSISEKKDIDRIPWFERKSN